MAQPISKERPPWPQFHVVKNNKPDLDRLSVLTLSVESSLKSPLVLTSNKTIHQIRLLKYILSRFTIVAYGSVYRT